MALQTVSHFGGVVYDTGGYCAVFGMVFGIIVLDFCFRLAMTEKKIASKWVDSSVSIKDETMSSKSSVDYLSVDGQQVDPKTKILDDEQSSSSCTLKHQSSTKNTFGTPIIFILLKSPRMLFTLWAVMVPILVIAAFDSVSALTSYLYALH